MSVVSDGHHIHQLKLVISDAPSSPSKEVADCHRAGDGLRARRHQSAVGGIHWKKGIEVCIVYGGIPLGVHRDHLICERIRQCLAGVARDQNKGE